MTVYILTSDSKGNTVLVRQNNNPQPSKTESKQEHNKNTGNVFENQQIETKQQKESVSFFDERWSGHQIAKLTGDNAITDWLQNKDKVCTDGKDDGKIGLWEGTKSLVKGLVGGIPKAIINHPVATAVAVAAGAGAIALTGGAILPVLGAVGVATGVGMAGYGGYKAATAKTDGEAKQALETLGMGVTTTALSMASADKALEKAAEAGVKSAQVSKDAGIIDKTVQMFKSIPESLTKSMEWTKFNFGLNVQGTYKKYDSGILVKEKTPAGTVKKYDVKFGFFKHYGVLKEEQLADGTYRKYDVQFGFFKHYGVLKEEQLADGTKIKYYNGKIKHVIEPNGTRRVFCKDNIVEETLPGKKTQYSWDKLKRMPKGTTVQKYSDGSQDLFYPNRRLIRYNPDGSIKKVSTWSYKENNVSQPESVRQLNFKLNDPKVGWTQNGQEVTYDELQSIPEDLISLQNFARSKGFSGDDAILAAHHYKDELWAYRNGFYNKYDK